MFRNYFDKSSLSNCTTNKLVRYNENINYMSLTRFVEYLISCHEIICIMIFAPKEEEGSKSSVKESKFAYSFDQ